MNYSRLEKLLYRHINSSMTNLVKCTRILKSLLLLFPRSTLANYHIMKLFVIHYTIFFSIDLREYNIIILTVSIGPSTRNIHDLGENHAVYVNPLSCNLQQFP